VEKNNYMAKLGANLSDPLTGTNKYWTIMKKIVNSKVATVIPPILEGTGFITDIKEKCDAFNEYFRKQCTMVQTDSFLPLFNINTELSLSEVNFSQADITVILAKLQPDKAHGHDGLTARILKNLSDTISLPLLIIFKNCISQGYFPKKWKMANVVPIFKKNEKNLIKNYRPVSLLPLLGKILERLIFINLYPYIFNNKFIDDRQSGYRRGDSTVKQLLSITHEIYKAFDDSKELRAVFLDISKAFDKVWIDGLIFKLKRIGINGTMLQMLTSFLSERKQRVTLDGVVSDWVDLEAGVPQGSLLGPILFLVYINDIAEVVDSDIRIFADDTFIFRRVDQNSSTKLNSDLEKINDWANQWKMIFNPDISKQAVEIVFSRKKERSIFDPLVFNQSKELKKLNT